MLSKSSLPSFSVHKGGLSPNVVRETKPRIETGMGKAKYPIVGGALGGAPVYRKLESEPELNEDWDDRTKL